MTDTDLMEMAEKARRAGRKLAVTSTAARNKALGELASRLEVVGDALARANEADLAEARGTNIAPSLLDRMTLTPKRIQDMIQGCLDVAALPDPLNEVFDGRTLPNGLQIARKRVPLGVLASIYESRPNVTVDIGALAIKTGNAAIMRGGKECLRTNQVLARLIHEASAAAELPVDSVQLVTSTDRALVLELLAMDDVIDLVIPRGGTGLQNLVREHAKMPVMYGGIGVCHLYVDATADLRRSVAVIHNSKTQAPSVCNALDTVLVHRAVLDDLMPLMVSNLVASQVQVRCDEPSLRALGSRVNREFVRPAGPDDYGQEFLSLVLSVKTVESLDEALAHIDRYGTHHSDGILTNTYEHAQRFLAEVDSAVVYVNASTRFTDGGQFGLGAEVAISTQKMHARGPVGLRELTTYKWIVQGDYHVRP
jgi:glutamate-5-semialdehyde dehydrogenase